MSISTTTRKAGPFTGNGVQTVFAFAFKVFAQSDVQVIRSVAATGIETILTLGVDYTVALNADQDAAPGGTITLSVALTAAQRLVITSAVTPLQSVVVTNGGGFFPAVFNGVFDKLTVLIQQLTERASRVLTVAISTSGVVDLTIPVRALGVIRWNSAGTALETVDTVGAALPSQAGQGGKVLTTDGANASWTDTLASLFLAGASSTFGVLTVAAVSGATRVFGIYGDTPPSDGTNRRMSVERDGATVFDSTNNAAFTSKFNGNNRLRVTNTVVAVEVTLDLLSGQLAFPATQNPSAGVNVLDDYEEGTFAPGLTFQTPGNLVVTGVTSNGRYTKKGREVTLEIEVAGTLTHTTASGTLLVSGVPFAAASTNGPSGVVGAVGSGLVFNNGAALTALFNTSTTLRVVATQGGGSGSNNLTTAACPTGVAQSFFITITYFAAT